jgi:hypothetical protein
MKVTLKNVRLSFPELWHPKEFKTGDGKPRYSATFLIEPGSANDKAIRAAIEEEGTNAFKAKWEKAQKDMWGNSNKCCYLDGDRKEYDGYAGNWYIASHNRARPLVIDRDRTPLTEDDGKPYAGCYVNAIVDIYVQTGENPGIRASLSGVQFYKDGDAFGGGSRASTDDFDDLADLGEEDDLA